MSSILVLNGPNLNLLGEREPDIYGAQTLADVEHECVLAGQRLGFGIVCAQSNFEGGLVEELHAARGLHAGVVLNAGAFTHSSIALRDAISGIALPVIELHISNVHARESFRHVSMIAPVCMGVIAGLGTAGYPLAIQALAQHIAQT